MPSLKLPIGWSSTLFEQTHNSCQSHASTSATSVQTFMGRYEGLRSQSCHIHIVVVGQLAEIELKTILYHVNAHATISASRLGSPCNVHICKGRHGPHVSFPARRSASLDAPPKQRYLHQVVAQQNSSCKYCIVYWSTQKNYFSHNFTQFFFLLSHLQALFI